MRHVYQSNRLTYRQIEATDWEFFYRLYANPKVMGFICDIEPKLTIRRKFLCRTANWNNESSEWLSILISLTESTAALGITGIKLDKSDNTAELGYVFCESAWGKGYAQESLAALLHYSQHSLNTVNFKAIVTDGNISSEKLLIKTGFKKEQVVKDAIFLNGQWHDDLIYRLTL